MKVVCIKAPKLLRKIILGIMKNDDKKTVEKKFCK